MTRLSPSVGRHSRTALSASVAAVALALVAGEASAQAQDPCGPVVDGAVDCTIDLPLPTGVQYDEDDGIIVRLQDGLDIAPIDGYAAVHLTSTNGSIQLDAAGSDLTTRNAGGVVVVATGPGDVLVDVGSVSTTSGPGFFGHGIDVINDFGNIAITVERVTTAGDNSLGIITNAIYGNTTINAGTVTTNGEYALGIIANSVFGAIDITADLVDVTGFAADAITVTGGGNINIDVNEIRGSGDYVWGVYALNGILADDQVFAGNTDINVGTIDITGDYAAGVILETYGSAYVSIGDLSINGANGTGVSVLSLDDAVVRVGDARFTGIGSGGISAQSNGSAFVTVDSLIVENGGGVSAQGFYGFASVTAGLVDVAGDFARGVQAASNYSDAQVIVDDVRTRGLFADGVRIEAFKGQALASIGTVSTDGDYSSGVVVFGGVNTISVRGAVSTTGEEAFGVLTSSTMGDISLNLAGPVTTLGDMSRAVWATGRYGTAKVRVAGTVSTAGVDAAGIFGVGEDGQIDIAVNTVRTTGANSDGVSARTRFVEVFQGMSDVPNPAPFTGNIDIVAATVEVTGEGSMGITARGLGDATILAGDISALDSFAIETDMIGEAAITLRGTARSTLGSAISAQGSDVSVNIAATGHVVGAVDGLIISAVGERCTQREDGVSINPCPNPGDYFVFPDAAPDYVPTAFAGTAKVTNDGLIEGGSGYAVRVEHGALALANNGRIVGGVLFAEGDDVFDNRGIFDISKTSDFGAGSDLFRNSGTVRFNPAATAVAAISLTNLERFENSGLIDLRNAAIGDTLTISGDFVGSTGSTLALDVDMATGQADRITIGGSATGTTAVTLDVDNDAATLIPNGGVTIIQVGSGSSDTAFVMAEGEGDKGFIGYSLAYDAASRSYALASAASDAAYRQTGLLQASDDVWASSADLWSANGATARDATFAGDDARRAWGSMQGGRVNRDWSSSLADGSSADLDYRQTRYGAQFGYDMAALNSGAGALRVGVTGGFGESSLDYRRTGDGFDLSTVNIGVYAGAVRNAVFANLLVKYDRHDVEVRSTAMDDDAELTGSTWGADGEVGYRFGDAGMFVEPIVGARWTSTSSDDLVHGVQTLVFEDSDDLAGRLGVRVGGGTTLGGGDQIAFYASAHAVHHFGDAYQVRLTSGASQTIEAERVDTYGQGVFGLSYRTRAGLETFAEGQGDLGSGYDALAARVGVRLRF